ncbi:adenosylmethionine-8-amino-7-oxononanoate aminotransferase [Planctomycetales bacterium]|nr:adenosylmethionine-8-amino-7-oxononanoate aminotransferase [Planctomycetales bacterium]GHS99408.1 adenosylmethionine-8-amino-7-oxononanoate aminotransferase [Planctomycetales bacterium]GHT06174.1 adenosylmethionine-8-amino-7-oxononanoate aminotransferase [Planctomycetales bacterium]
MLSPLQQLDLRHIWHPCSQMKDYETLPPIVIERGAGSCLYDTDGKEYIDIISSWWCNLLGHCHPRISAAIHDQLDQLEHVIFANFSHRPAIVLAARLAEILPRGLTKFNFSDNGSAAVEAALKMSFQYQAQTGNARKTRFMCLTGAYHGETIGALSVGAVDLYTQIYRPLLLDAIRLDAPDCFRCPFGKTRDACACECASAAEASFAKFGETTAALIIEPLLQGSAGMRIYPAAYLRRLRDLCDRYGVLLIADEIATGFGRTGKMFACDHAEISPDIMCLSKGLSGGYLPFALTATTERVFAAFYADYREGRAFMHSHTYSGNPLGCRAALAVLDVLASEPIFATAAANAEFLTGELNAALLDHPNVGEIRHLGLIHAVELVADKKTKTALPAARRTGYQIYREALRRGLLLRPLGDVLYFNPPLNTPRETLARAVALCREAVESEF